MYHPLYSCLLTLCCARFIFQCFIVCRCCECSFFIGCLQIIVCIVFRALSSVHVLLALCKPFGRCFLSVVIDADFVSCCSVCLVHEFLLIAIRIRFRVETSFTLLPFGSRWFCALSCKI